WPGRHAGFLPVRQQHPPGPRVGRRPRPGPVSPASLWEGLQYRCFSGLKSLPQNPCARMGMKRTLFIVAACLALAACASIPLGTLWKLRSLDENTLVQLEPSDLRAALSLASAVAVEPGSVKLSLELDREGAGPESHAFGLEPGTGPGPLERDLL